MILVPRRRIDVPRSALRSRQRGFILNPFAFGGGGGGAPDPDFASVIALLHMDGANGGTTFTDSSPLAATYTPGGTVTTSAADQRFGPTSAFFASTGSRVDSPSSATYTLGTSNFTIEGWWKSPALSSNQRFFFDMRNPSTNGSYPTIYAQSAQIYYQANGVRITGAINLDNWNHVALCRSGTSTRIFVNGLQVGSTFSDSTNYIGTRMRIGSAGNVLTSESAGYIDEVRVTKGVARYTANFTPPSAPFPDS